jgi:hypothetical protein
MTPSTDRRSKEYRTNFDNKKSYINNIAPKDTRIQIEILRETPVKSERRETMSATSSSSSKSRAISSSTGRTIDDRANESLSGSALTVASDDEMTSAHDFRDVEADHIVRLSEGYTISQSA